MDLDTLPDRLSDAVADELEPDEEVVWIGRPDPDRHATSAWLLALLGIPWIVFAMFWTLGAAGLILDGAGPMGAERVFLSLFGVPFILIGCGLVTAPIWTRWDSHHTAYLVTDRRAILFEGGLWVAGVRSFGPDQLGSVHRVERVDGYGDVILTAVPHRDGEGYWRIRPAGFYAIPDVKHVEKLLKDLAAQAAGKTL